MEEKEVVIVGGSYSGLAAALYLVRSRRDVLVIDNGKPRNRFADRSHGVFALDGRPGSELLAKARSQYLKYPCAGFLSNTVVRVIKRNECLFEVETEGERCFRARRLILATGVVDVLPSIPGLEERWGRSVFHCPYCDGYESGCSSSIGVIATLSSSVEYAQLITDWGKVTLFTNNAIQLDDRARRTLAKTGVRVEEREISGLEGPTSGLLDLVRLKDGSKVHVKTIFIATAFRMSAPFAKDLGCDMASTPRGELVRTNDSKMTTVAGVYAAGDMARLTHSIPHATSDGVTAGVSVHQSLVDEESG